MEESNRIRSGPIIRLQRLRFKRQEAEDAEVRNGSAPVLPPARPPRRLTDEERYRLNERLWPIIKCYPNPPWPEPWSVYLLPMRFRQSRPQPSLLAFINHLIESAGAGRTLQSYTFFEQYCLYPNLVSVFTLQAASFMSMLGVGVRPEQGPPRFPTQRQIEGVDQERAQAVTEEKKQGMTMQDFFPDMPAGVYRIKQNQARARELLLGEGGWSLILSPLEEQPFLERSKALLLEGVRDDALRSIPLLVPLLGINSFMDETLDRLQRWFGVIELYLGECPQEGGLVIASRTSLDELLIKAVQQFGLPDQRASQRR